MLSANGKCGNKVIWRLENETLTISIEGPREDREYIIEHDGLVNKDREQYSVSPWLREGREKAIIRRVIIEEGVTGIGMRAFGSSDLVLEERRDEQPIYNNQHLYLESVSIADSVTSIDESAFYRCTALKELKCSASLKTIGDRAFAYCSSLRSISLPSSLRSVGFYAFAYCTALKQVAVPQSVGEVRWGAFKETPFWDQLKQKPGVIMVGRCAYAYRGSESRVKIPDGTYMIGDRLFMHHIRLTEVEIPDGVKMIGASAFQGCIGLQKLTLPDSVEVIKFNAFYGCTDLLEISMDPASIEFPASAFERTPWWRQQSGSVISKDTLVGYAGTEACYTIPQNVKEVATGAIKGAALKELVIPPSVSFFAYSGCSDCMDLTTVSLPEDLRMFVPRRRTQLPEGYRILAPNRGIPDRRNETPSIELCRSVRRIYYGEKYYDVKGISDLGYAGDNVIWVQQKDNTILLLGKGTVDPDMLITCREEDYADFGSYWVYYYVWGSEWGRQFKTERIVIGDGVKLQEPLSETLPPGSVASWEHWVPAIEARDYSFQVIREPRSVTVPDRTAEEKNALYWAPVMYEGDPLILSEPDFEIHLFPEAEKRIAQGDLLPGGGRIPAGYWMDREGSARSMRLRTITNISSGMEMIPLYTDLWLMQRIFPRNIRVSVVDLQTARELCLQDPNTLSGLIINPGTGNRIIPLDQLKNLK